MLQTGVLSVALGVFLLAATFVVRLTVVRRERRDKALTDEWTPYLLGVGPTPVFPRRRSDRRAVLALWNRVRATVKGSATGALEGRGRRTGLDEFAVELLSSRRPEDRINAVHAVGAMHKVRCVPQLVRMVGRGQSIALRQEASRALVRLDTVRGIPIVIEALRANRDWHPAIAASVLEEGEPDFVALAVGREVTRAAEDGDIDFAARLMRVLTAVRSEVGLRHVRALLHHTTEPDLQASCLFVLGHFANKSDARLVRQFASSDVWYVRVHAAAALGGVGSPDDEPTLTGLLHDEEWWVRQRAVESLTRLDLLPPEELAIVFEDHQEAPRFAGVAYSPAAEVFR